MKMTKKHLRKYSLAMNLGMQIRTTGRVLLTSVRMAQTGSAGEGGRDREPSSVVGGSATWCSHSRNQNSQEATKKSAI